MPLLSFLSDDTRPVLPAWLRRLAPAGLEGDARRRAQTVGVATVVSAAVTALLAVSLGLDGTAAQFGPAGRRRDSLRPARQLRPLPRARLRRLRDKAVHARACSRPSPRRSTAARRRTRRRAASTFVGSPPPRSMPKQPSWRAAAVHVLRESGSAMNAGDITKRIIDQNIRSSVGATPAATVASRIYMSIKNDGDDSPFVKVGKGMFALREVLASASAPAAKAPDKAAEPPDDEADAGLVGAFGMYWDRGAVHWANTPKLLGQQDLKATAVDFAAQSGVYLLHDGRDVVYVGRASLRKNGHGLGKRLFEHTSDRMKGRWNRFSWFGLLPVREDGSLGTLPDSFLATESLLVSTLEALLIEALEPPQNRRRGDDFQAVEFIQVEDPEHEKSRRAALLQELMKRI